MLRCQTSAALWDGIPVSAGSGRVPLGQCLLEAPERGSSSIFFYVFLFVSVLTIFIIIIVSVRGRRLGLWTAFRSVDGVSVRERRLGAGTPPRSEDGVSAGLGGLMCGWDAALCCRGFIFIV